MHQPNRPHAGLGRRRLLDRLQILQVEEIQLETEIACEADDLKSSEVGDRAQAMAELENGFALRRAIQTSKQHALRALERADSGSYGLCEDCGVRIPKLRLEICPDATRCVRCQHSSDFGFQPTRSLTMPETRPTRHYIGSSAARHIGSSAARREEALWTQQPCSPTNTRLRVIVDGVDLLTERRSRHE